MNKYDAFEELIEKIYTGTRVVNKYQSQPRQYGSDIILYMAEVHTLAMIFKKEGITVSELAENTQKTRSAITQTVNKLEKKGLVIKERNKDYHKVINLFTTDIGKETCHYHNELDHKNYERTVEALEAFSVEDFKRFGELYEIIYEEIQKDS